MKSLLMVLALASSFHPTQEVESPRPATVDISAIRFLDCGDWVGSGFLIGDKIMATALHVVANDAKCIDVASGSTLTVYKTDLKHDLALVTGPKLPTNIPYVKYSCARFVTGKQYLSYGITPYGMNDWYNPIVRMNTLTATANYTGKGDTVDGTPAEGMRVFDGLIAPGMSGGPVVDLNGYAHAVNNAGSDSDTILYEFADGMLCGH